MTMRSVISSPLNPGRCRSHNTTSGCRRLICGSPVSPFSASPTTSMPVSPERIILMPVRTSAWSSMRNTLMVMRTPLPGKQVTVVTRRAPCSGQADDGNATARHGESHVYYQSEKRRLTRGDCPRSPSHGCHASRP
ncbi:hypothetical protein STPYR_11209 [uncultured Stenotrophomonas sp.]|uniref:Uncharacterized protein n=1 Tax=uncultured Stenotrophomonas sp. TaxID=165438 RepID=A0A1Y5Q1V2_9GAMM|nr:hypothetical protein STPYR_11209 [uncultured Stenotrophomonas sp.]